MKEVLTRFVDGSYNPILIEFPSLCLCEQRLYQEIRRTAYEILEKLQELESSSIVEFDDTVDSAPAIAGLILSYPAIYHSKKEDKLVDAEITIFSVHIESPEQRILMQFSCPPRYRDQTTQILMKTATEMEARIGRIPESLREEWHGFTRGKSCKLKAHIETRRVSILSL